MFCCRSVFIQEKEILAIPFTTYYWDQIGYYYGKEQQKEVKTRIVQVTSTGYRQPAAPYLRAAILLLYPAEFYLHNESM